ncbi:MAG: exodeoxyribonuclease VII large subunit [Nitrospira sp.]|nr:exodeoxyribonuclease VII large subunit [Nitrospira sp.]
MIQERHILSVSEVTSLIKVTLEDSFYDVWVEGEIFNLRIPSSGHVYFTLKDNSSQIRAVLFRSSSRSVKFIPKDGLNVICRGRVSVYEFRGEYQIIVDYMEPKGVGALLLAFEQLKERLSKEGLFDESRKRPIPLFPKKIGIVTSPTGAAIRDILKVIERRFANVEIVIAPASVQGERAAPEIVEAIADLNNIEDIDVIIAGRGGGGIEDLWPFNEEIVARAIYNSRIPVISAVGHEVDYTIADFVADLRAPTPSAAAEMVVKNKEDVQRHIGTLYSRLIFAKKTLLDKKKEKVLTLSRRIFSPERDINRYIQRLDDIDVRMSFSMQRIIKDSRNNVVSLLKGIHSCSPAQNLLLKRHKLESRTNSILKTISQIISGKTSSFHIAAARLDSLSPLAILSRGYSITSKLPSRTIVKSYRDVQSGEKVSVRLHEGNLICVVEASKIE